MESGIGEAVIYLVNGTSALSVRRILAAACGQVGVMVTPAGGKRVNLIEEYGCFAMDTGCYSQGVGFDVGTYLRMLADLAPYHARCLFATAPDVVGDAAATWERSRGILPVIRGLGFPPALVAQDGIERMAVDWTAFACLSIGGTTHWKLTVGLDVMTPEAKRRGKHVHLGRVNSLIRLRAAQSAGCDSADGTMLAFGPDLRARQLLVWLAELERQPALPLWAVPRAMRERGDADGN